MTDLDQIFVDNISFVGRHGVSAKERATGQQMRIDLRVWLDTRAAARSDRLARTVDYGALTRMVVELGSSSSFKLLETLADRIATQVLETCAAQAVEVRVKKRHPSLVGTPSAAGVCIRRDRS